MKSPKKKGALLYGAYGYTGRLIAEAAAKAGLDVTLAGRREEPLAALGSETGLPWKAFPLDDAARVEREIAPFSALFLAAGPFSRTSAPAVEACLKARTHYLDVTGEIDVFEAVFARDAEARAAGVALLPGCGFDVVPSDALAGLLAAALPSATRLVLAFRGFKASAGTMKTMLEGFPKGGRARKEGRLVEVPAGWKTRTVPFPDKPRLCMSIPWGDLSTAWRSTGIPDIETYMSVPSWFVTASRLSRPLAPLARLSPVHAFLEARIAAGTAGPNAAERAREKSRLWGRVEDDGGRSVEATATAPEGYTLTADAAAFLLGKVLGGEARPGSWTPAQAFGPGILSALPGTTVSVGKVAAAPAVRER